MPAKLVLGVVRPEPIVNSMANLITNIIKVVRGKDRKRIKERVKKVVERDRVLQSKLAKAS